MPAAIAIPAIIGAAGVGTSLVGAKMASNAAKGAAETQRRAAEQAQGFNERVYQNQQGLMNPYVQAGQYALSNLMSRQYGGSPNQFTPPQQYGAPIGAQPAQGYSPMLQRQPMNAPQPQPGAIGAQPGNLSDLAGGMVTVQAPTGETKQVPRSQAQLYLSRGARMLQ